jgi:hypothetical protein
MIDFGAGNTLTLVQFATDSGRTHVDCSTCHADDASCLTAGQAFCPLSLAAGGPVGSNGPLGATTPRYPSCVDGCTGCGSLAADPANPAGWTGKKGSKGSSVPRPLDCSVVTLTVADDGSDDNTCAAVAATCNAGGGKSGKSGNSGGNSGDSGGKKKTNGSTGNPTEGASSANPAIIGAAIAATVVLAIGVAAVRSRISWLPDAAGAVAPELSESVAEPSATTATSFHPRANAMITNPMYEVPGTDGV